MSVKSLLESALEELLYGDPMEAAFNFRKLSDQLEYEEPVPSQESLVLLLTSLTEE